MCSLQSRQVQRKATKSGSKHGKIRWRVCKQRRSLLPGYPAQKSLIDSSHCQNRKEGRKPGVTSSLEEEKASRMTVFSSGWLLRSTWCPTSPNESRASSLMESVERLFFTSCQNKASRSQPVIWSTALQTGSHVNLCRAVASHRQVGLPGWTVRPQQVPRWGRLW